MVAAVVAGVAAAIWSVFKCLIVSKRRSVVVGSCMRCFALHVALWNGSAADGVEKLRAVRSLHGRVQVPQRGSRCGGL